MWKLIDDSSILDKITVGQIITNNPDNPIDQYEVKTIDGGYIKATHCNGKTAIKVFPEEELIMGKWWVKR